MINFDFQIKTKLYFGSGKEKLVGEILSSKNAKKVMVIIGQSSVKKSGLLDLTLSSLAEHGIQYEVLEGVRPNPTIQFVYDGLVKAKSFTPDYLLAIGGGSVIDTAKSIAVGYYYDGDPFDFNRHVAHPTKALPIGVILTISASGSEMSTSCVIQNDDDAYKSGFNSEFVRPEFAIENPELTFSVTPTQTAYGIVDIMMHTMERYFQPSAENEPCDGFSEALLKSVIQAGKDVMKNPHDYQARAVLMLMSSLSHNGLTSIGKTSYMPVHQLEHALSGCYPQVAHAAGLSVLFPAWANFYLEYDVDKFDRFAKNVFDSHLQDKVTNAKKGVELLKEYFSFLHMPHSFGDLGIENIDIDKLVSKATNDGTRVIGHHVKPIDQDVASEIYRSCI